MCNPQIDKGPQLPPQQGLPSKKTNEQSHFVRARKIVESWPEWKRNIHCAPMAPNGNQSNPQSDQGN
jgi:hypothetical protein